MMEYDNANPAIFTTVLLAVALAFGGCASGNVAGPQPETPENTVTQNDPGSVGGVVTNGGDGTSGSAGHNVSHED